MKLNKAQRQNLFRTLHECTATSDQCCDSEDCNRTCNLQFGCGPGCKTVDYYSLPLGAYNSAGGFEPAQMCDYPETCSSTSCDRLHRVPDGYEYQYLMFFTTA